MAVDMKSIIADTYIDLTKKKSVDKITVKDIVETCGISRQTFYYHFQDLLAVLEWFAQQEFKKALEQSKAADSQEATVKIMVQTTVDRYDLICKLLHSRNRETIESIMMEATKEGLREHLRKKTPEVPLNYVDAEMEVEFYAAGITNILLTHCGEKDLNIDLLSAQLCRLLPSRFLDGA